MQRVKTVKYFHISYITDNSVEARRWVSRATFSAFCVVLDDSKSITNIHGPQRMNLNDFGDPLFFYITNR